MNPNEPKLDQTELYKHLVERDLPWFLKPKVSKVINAVLIGVAVAIVINEMKE